MADKQRYNLILLGDVSVGKTSLFNRIKTGRFHENQSTLGEECFEKTVTVDGDQVRVLLWDTGGCERHRALTNGFFRKANGALLVYCVEDSYTFENLQKWIEDASGHLCTESFVWAVIGNKCDLPNEVEKIKVEQLCEQLKTKLFYSVSAKTGHNVVDAFQDVVTTIHNMQTHRQNPTIDDTSSGSIKVEHDNFNSKSGTCCTQH